MEARWGKPKLYFQKNQKPLKLEQDKLRKWLRGPWWENQFERIFGLTKQSLYLFNRESAYSTFSVLDEELLDEDFNRR